MKNKKVLFTSLAVIMMALSTGVGATYALFTSKSNTNIVISTAKVKVSAAVSNLKTYSGKWNERTQEYDLVEQSGTSFSNGGSVTLNNDTLSIDKISPMDKVSFDIDLTNESNINVLYRTIIKCDGSARLFDALEVKIDGETYTGRTLISEWKNLIPNQTLNKVSVEIYLPQSVENEYQGLSTKLVYSIEATQGNTNVTNQDSNIIPIYGMADFLSLIDESRNGETFEGKTVILNSDISFEDMEFTPLSYFKGTFDGGGYTISNINYQDLNDEKVGLIETLEGTIKNVKIKDCSFEGLSEIGTLCGTSIGGSLIKDCEITSSIIKAMPSTSKGDYVGVVAGTTSLNSSIENVTVSDSIIEGFNYVGGFVGKLDGNITSSKIENTDIIQSSENGYITSAYYLDEIAGMYDETKCIDIVKGSNEVYSRVTPETFDNVDFAQDNRLFRFFGTYDREKLSINSKSNLTQFYDGSLATFNCKNIKLNYEIMDSLSTILTDEEDVTLRTFKEKQGKHIATGFSTPNGSISVGAVNTTVELSNMNGLAFDANASNAKISLKDSSFTLESGSVYRFDGKEKNYAFFMLGFNYDFSMDNCTIYSKEKNALNFCSRGEWDIGDFNNGKAGEYLKKEIIENKISVKNSNITSVDGKLLNIWGDHTYGSNYEINADNYQTALPEPTKELIRSLLNSGNTFSVNDEDQFIQIGGGVLSKTYCQSL